MHTWKTAIEDNRKVLKCIKCGFIWLPDTAEPTLTCNEILGRYAR